MVSGATAVIGIRLTTCHMRNGMRYFKFWDREFVESVNLQQEIAIPQVNTVGERSVQETYNTEEAKQLSSAHYASRHQANYIP
jgi:hypothetical protein